MVLRTTRLAGYPGATVGADGKNAVLSLTMPSVLSAADAELAWQSGLAMLAVAYPRARTYRIALDMRERTLLAVAFNGSEARRALEEDDPAALRGAAEFAIPGDKIEKMPEQSLSTAGHEAQLDLDNRTAYVGSIAGPAVSGADALTAAWHDAYARAPGVPAPSGTQDAASFAAERITTALEGAKLEGEQGLRELVTTLVAENAVTTLRAYAAAVEAVNAAKPLASVLALTAEATREAAKAAPVRHASGAVTALPRAASLDAGVGGTSFPSEVLARFGTQQGNRVGLVWRGVDDAPTDQPHVTAPDRWIAYRAADGCVYWVAGEGGEFALTDSSLMGWGYQTFSASIVDVNDIRTVLATFPRPAD